MKTPLMLILVTIVCLGALSGVQAVAQKNVSSFPSGPTAAPAALPATQNGVAAGQSPQTAAGSPQATPGTPPDTSFLIDNGLWEGADVGACCAICGGGSCAPPDWYTQQGVSILNRSRPRGIDIGNDLVGATFDPTLQTNQFNQLLNTRSVWPNIAVAYDMTIGHYFARDTSNCDNFVEFTYWGFNDWQDEAQLNGHRVTTTATSGLTSTVAGSIYSGFLNDKTMTYLAGFNAADLQSTYYTSTNNNFEINGRIIPRNEPDRLVLEPNGRWRRECQPGMYMSYLYGIRFMQIDETFRFHSQGRTDNYVEGVYTNSETDTGDYDIVSHNNLLGLQFGTDITFRQCRWSWGVNAKLGPYVNFSDQVSNVLAQDVTTPTVLLTDRLSAAKHDAAFIGQLGFEATYKFRPNLMGRAGYDFMWVTGLALAPEQLQLVLNPVNRINTNGLIFYQGVSLSLEWMW